MSALILPSSGRVAFVDADRGVSGVTMIAFALASFTPWELHAFVMSEYDNGCYSEGFYGESEIGGDIELSGFKSHMSLVAKNQVKDQTAFLYGQPKTTALTNLDAPFMLGGGIFDAYTGVAMPEDWTGVARNDKNGSISFMYYGSEGGERTFNGLAAVRYADAIEEAASRFGVDFMRDYAVRKNRPRA